MVDRDDADEESGAVVNHFDMTVADSDPSVEVTPRHHLAVGSTQPTRVDSLSANRFAALRDNDDPFAEDSSNESERPTDPEFVDGVQEVPLLPRDDPVAQVRRPEGEVIQDITVNPAIRAALRSLDEVDVQHLFRDRAVVIKSLPSMIRGAYKSAMRMALREAADRASARDEVGLCRAWKLFLLLPRMLLHRHLAEGSFPSVICLRGSPGFREASGWSCCSPVRLLPRTHDEHSFAATGQPSIPSNAGPSARSVWHSWVNLSLARQALEGDAVAPGNDHTLQALRDPLRRPPVPRDPLPVDLQHFQPEVPLSLEQDRLLRRGTVRHDRRPPLASVGSPFRIQSCCGGCVKGLPEPKFPLSENGPHHSPAEAHRRR